MTYNLATILSNKHLLINYKELIFVLDPRGSKMIKICFALKGLAV